MKKLKNRTHPLSQKDIEEFFDEHLPYRMTLLATHKLINKENTSLKNDLKDFFLNKINICTVEASLIASRMFIEFLGLGIKLKPLRLSQNREYFNAEDGNSYEVKVIDLGGEWVNVNKLKNEEKDLLARMYLTGHRATAHLTFNAPYRGEWKIIHDANDLIYRLLKSHLYDVVGKEIKIK